MKIFIKLFVINMAVGVFFSSPVWADKVAFSKLAEEFFVAARNGDNAAMESAMSPAWLATLKPAVFGRFLAEFGLDDFQNVSWGSSEIENEIGKLSGEFASSNSTFPITLTFSKNDGTWLVQGVSVLPSKPPIKPAIPSYESTLALVSGTMQAFASAVNERDMRSFAQSASKTFRIRHGVDDLNQTFSQFFGQGNFHDRINVAPGLAEPTLKNGYLLIEGGYQAAGYETNFKLDYAPDDGVWKIVGIGLSSDPQ